MREGTNELVGVDPAALLAAAVWLMIASWQGWPVSTTHTIIGGLVGFEEWTGRTLSLSTILGYVLSPMDWVNGVPWQEAVTEDAVGQVGFERDEGLLPYDHRTFSGYRMLHEYFAFKDRFIFFRLNLGLKTDVLFDIIW